MLNAPWYRHRLMGAGAGVLRQDGNYRIIDPLLGAASRQHLRHPRRRRDWRDVRVAAESA
jgi:hypothetical protein